MKRPAHVERIPLKGDRVCLRSDETSAPGTIRSVRCLRVSTWRRGRRRPVESREYLCEVRWDATQSRGPWTDDVDSRDLVLYPTRFDIGDRVRVWGGPDEGFVGHVDAFARRPRGGWWVGIRADNGEIRRVRLGNVDPHENETPGPAAPASPEGGVNKRSETETPGRCVSACPACRGQGRVPLVAPRPGQNPWGPCPACGPEAA